MKLSIHNNNFAADIDVLKNKLSTEIINQQICFVNDLGQAYMYFTTATEGVSPNDLPSTGRWVQDIFITAESLINLVDDDYDFSGNGCSDVTNIFNWIAVEKKFSYITIREGIKQYVNNNGFANLSDDEKSHVAEYCATDDATLVGYYMSIGYTLEGAKSVHGSKRSRDIDKAASICMERANSSASTFLISKYLGEQTAINFLNTITNLVKLYERAAHMSQLINNTPYDGLIDFIGNTGGYQGYLGLESYAEAITTQGYTVSDARSEMINYFQHGIMPIGYIE